MDMQTLIIYCGGLIVALILLKLIIKLPVLLIKYGVWAALIYLAYIFFSGQSPDIESFKFW